MPECGDEAHDVPDQVQDAERVDVAVVGTVPTRGAAIAPLIGGDDVIARRRDRQHHLAPAVGELREAVQQQNTRAVLSFESRLQHVHGEAVDAVDEAGMYAGWQSALAVGFPLSHYGFGRRGREPGYEVPIF